MDSGLQILEENGFWTMALAADGMVSHSLDPPLDALSAFPSSEDEKTPIKRIQEVPYDAPLLIVASGVRFDMVL